MQKTYPFRWLWLVLLLPIFVPIAIVRKAWSGRRYLRGFWRWLWMTEEQ